MSRYLLVTTAASVAIAASLAAPAMAANITTAVTTPVQTQTANGGNPDSITITSTGSVKPASGTAVTQNTNHAVTNQGTIQVSGANGAAGIVSTAGTTGDILNSKDIIIDEAYTATDADNDGDLDGPYALGSNRFGIRTDGAHSGKITNDATGVITIEGNDSAGIWLGGTQTGNFTNDGKIGVLGDRGVGIHAEDIVGNVRVAGDVAVQGKDAVGVEFTGDVTGAMVIQGNVTATGYRRTNGTGDTSKLDADDLLQGGSALIVEGNVTGGIVLAAAPKDNSSTDNDEDDDGIEDSKEGIARVTSYGAAPAMVIGSTTDNIVIGPVAGTASQFGLQIEGSIAGNGVYTGVNGNGLVVGGLGGTVNIANGISVAGSVTATSKDANATGLRLGTGATTPVLQVASTGTIGAGGSTTGATKATALQVDAGASLGTIKNAGTIAAVANATAGNATAILDLSGGVTLIENSGKITAGGAAADSTRNIAIDVSANTTGVTIKQTAVAAGAAAPVITGDVRFGTGNDLFDVADGTVNGTTYFGNGNNTYAISGDAVITGKTLFGTGNDVVTLAGTSAYNGTIDFAGGGTDTLTLGGTSKFSGSLLNAGTLGVTVNGGTLDIAKPQTLGSLTVGAGGTLLVTLDKTAGEGTAYNIAGTASFATGSTLMVRINDTENVEGRYTILEAGTLTGVSGITTKTDLVPFMFKASLATDAGPNKIAVDVARKSTTELGLNRSQASAYNAIFAALSADDQIEGVFLGVNDGDTFRDKVRMMLPDHAGGAFESISLATRTFGQQVGDPYGPVYTTGSLDIILNGAGWNANKDEGDTQAYDLGGFGFSAGAEFQTGVGSFGITGQWLWNEYTADSEDNLVQSDTYEAAAYWRGQWGKLNGWVRGSYGMVNFSGRRTFMGTSGTTNVERSALREWDGTLTTFSGGASYEGGKGFFYRPSVTFDYVRLSEDGYTDTGGGTGLNLIVDDRKSDEFAVNGGITLGLDMNGNDRFDRNWFRVEGEGGWRQIVGGTIGSTTAHFAGGNDFTLVPDQTANGWYARLRAMGGDDDFSMSGELSAEDRNAHTAVALRGTLRMGF